MDWKVENNQLVKEYKFNNFIAAWAFMSKVALIAEKHNHHPTWENTYNYLKISLSTHDAGNVITEKDQQLAKAIDALSAN